MEHLNWEFILAAETVYILKASLIPIGLETQTRGAQQFMMAGGPIAWKSKLQTSTSLSSVEAEYVALCAASREAKWINQLLLELGFGTSQPIIIGEDNRGCISISNNNRTDNRTKHIDIKYHFVRDMINSKVIKLQYVPTETMIADMFTKPTASSKFKWCREVIVKSMIASLRGRVKIQSANHAEAAEDVELQDHGMPAGPRQGLPQDKSPGLSTEINQRVGHRESRADAGADAGDVFNQTGQGEGKMSVAENSFAQ